MVKRSHAPDVLGSCSSRVEVFRAAPPCSQTLEEILAETTDGAFVVDPRGLIILWSRAAERLLGRSAGEAVGLACWEALAGADGNGGRLCGQGCQALRTGTGEQDIHRLEMQTRTKAGQPVWLDITALETPASNDGRPLVVHLFRDVTAKMNALARIPRQSAALPGRTGLLSARERQVLSMIAVGANTRTMAARLRVSPATIRNHVQSIFGKLGVHSRLEAVAWMHRHHPGRAGGGSRARRGAQYRFKG
jgi:PAS domain S-box-containing protein